MKKAEIIRYWRNVRHLTLSVLEHFPPERFDFRPAPQVRSVAEQFSHIRQVELHIRKDIMGSSDWPDPVPATESVLDKAGLREKLAREHQTTVDMLRMLPEGKFAEAVDTKFGRITIEGLVMVAIDEEIHHRGNLYVYLRLMNIEPPQMVQNYGNIFLEDENG
jgi:uncharacterized damage-inducible protein DinB